jgi:hypothetical protein
MIFEKFTCISLATIFPALARTILSYALAMILIQTIAVAALSFSPNAVHPKGTICEMPSWLSRI